MSLESDDRAANLLTKILIVGIAGPAIFIASSYLVARSTWFLLLSVGFVPQDHSVLTPVIAVVLFAGTVTVSVGIIRLMWPGKKAAG